MSRYPWMPRGGQVGQTVVKTGPGDYDYAWATPMAPSIPATDIAVIQGTGGGTSAGEAFYTLTQAGGGAQQILDVTAKLTIAAGGTPTDPIVVDLTVLYTALGVTSDDPSVGTITNVTQEQGPFALVLSGGVVEAVTETGAQAGATLTLATNDVVQVVVRTIVV